MTPFREDLWNLPQWMYPFHWALFIICGALVVYGLWRRIRLWRMGQPITRIDQRAKRLGSLLLYALAVTWAATGRSTMHPGRYWHRCPA
jgi:hypothetical protein